MIEALLWHGGMVRVIYNDTYFGKFFCQSGKFLEVWSCLNSKKLAYLEQKKFPTASLASRWEVVFAI